MTQQARHVLVPIGGANGIRLRATFQDKGKTYTFDTQLHNLVARIDVGVYKHSVQISKDESGTIGIKLDTFQDMTIEMLHP